MIVLTKLTIEKFNLQRSALMLSNIQTDVIGIWIISFKVDSDVISVGIISYQSRLRKTLIGEPIFKPHPSLTKWTLM